MILCAIEKVFLTSRVGKWLKAVVVIPIFRFIFNFLPERCPNWDWPKSVDGWDYEKTALGLGTRLDACMFSVCFPSSVFNNFQSGSGLRLLNGIGIVGIRFCWQQKQSRRTPVLMLLSHSANVPICYASQFDCKLRKHGRNLCKHWRWEKMFDSFPKMQPYLEIAEASASLLWWQMLN